MRFGGERRAQRVAARARRGGAAAPGQRDPRAEHIGAVQHGARRARAQGPRNRPAAGGGGYMINIHKTYLHERPEAPRDAPRSRARARRRKSRGKSATAAWFWRMGACGTGGRSAPRRRRSVRWCLTPRSVGTSRRSRASRGREARRGMVESEARAGEGRIADGF